MKCLAVPASLAATKMCKNRDVSRFSSTVALTNRTAQPGRRRRNMPMPAKAAPSSEIDIGSGTGEALTVSTAKYDGVLASNVSVSFPVAVTSKL